MSGFLAPTTHGPMRDDKKLGSAQPGASLTAQNRKISPLPK